MPQKPIPLTNQQRSSQEELGGGSAIAMNVLRDEMDTLIRRPGLAYSALATESQINSSGIDCVYATYLGNLFAAGPNGSTHDIYRVTAGGYNTLSTDHTTRLLGSARPTVAETSAILAFAAGDDPQKVLLSTGVSSRLTGSPPQATHIIAHGLRLLANDPKVDESHIRYSDVATGTAYAGHEDWSSAGVSGYVTAEARPDPVVSVGENTNMVFGFGRTTLQVFAPDPTWFYSPVNTINLGCAAPHSIIRIDESFAWLDDKRRIVVSDGMSYSEISQDISKDLKDLTSVTDCFGFRLYEPPVDCLVWVFPTDGITFARQTSGGWSQFGRKTSDTGVWTALGVNCHTFHVQQSENLVGTTDGYVGEFSRSVETDFGTPIEAYVESGFVNRGTTARKRCRGVRVMLKRGTDTNTVARVARLSYADAPDDWCDPIWLDLGAGNDTYPVVQLNSLGVYRTRNWRLDVSTADEMAIVGIIENYDVLGA